MAANMVLWRPVERAVGFTAASRDDTDHPFLDPRFRGRLGKALVRTSAPDDASERRERATGTARALQRERVRL